MSLTTTTTAFKAMTDEDKAALRELQEYAKQKTGQDVKLADIIAAVTPSMETPAYLRGI